MGVLLLAIGVLVLVGWLLTRGNKAWRGAPEARDLPQADLLIEALYRDGVRLGYKHAWSHQVEAERQRVAVFVRRRDRVMLSSVGGGVLLVGVALAGALGVLPAQAEWAAGLRPWHWLALAGAVAGFCVWMAIALTPRDYARFSAAPGAMAAQMAAASAQLDEVAKSHSARQVEVARTYLTKLIDERFAAGLEQGRRETRQAQARLFNEADMQTRVSSAANAAYVQGRTDGASEVQRLASEAYGRGMADGQRSALSSLEERLRAERQAAYQSGWRAGVAEAQKKSGAAQPQTSRPRTRAEALALLEVAEAASQAEIDRRYRELRAAVHPDAMRSRKMPRAMVKLAEEQFKLIGEAYDILKG